MTARSHRRSWRCTPGPDLAVVLHDGRDAGHPLVADALEASTGACALEDVRGAFPAAGQPREDLVAVLGNRLLPLAVSFDPVPSPSTP
jgi:hypothetical protein